MTDLKDLDLTDLQSTFNCYRNLFYHRNVILKGIRKIAFRNMAHLSEAMAHCDSSSDSIRDDKWIEHVQQKMLADQGLDDIKLNKTLIAWATYYPLQVYLALLYAEVEFYRNFCIESDVLSDDVLSGYLDTKAAFALELASFRDCYLHPSEENAPSELNFLSVPGSYNLAPEMQEHIDDYLDRIRLKLIDVLKGFFSNLPDIQRLYCTYRYLNINCSRMAEHRDSQGMRHVNTQIQELSMQLSNIPDDVKCWSPDTRQKKAAHILAECLNEVSPSIPEQQYTSLVAMQTPMAAALLAPLVTEQAPTSYGTSRNATHTTKNIGAIRRIIITAGVLINEGATFQGTYGQERLQEMTTTMSRENFLVWFWDTLSTRGLQGAEEIASLSRVSTALLYEPLRLYAAIVQVNPQIAQPGLRHLATREKLHSLSLYRNSVFHVFEPRRNPVEFDLPRLDSEFFVEAFGHLYSDLAAFFGISN